MELRRYLALLRQKRLLIIVTVVAGLLGAYLITPRGSTFRARATIYVGSHSLPFNTGIIGQEAVGMQQIAATFSAMVPSTPIAQRALDITKIPRTPKDVAAATKAMVVPFTSLVLVQVTDRDPVVAQKLTNGMSQAFVELIQTFEPTIQTLTGAKPAQPAYVFEGAALPTTPIPKGGSRNFVLGGLLGLLFSIGLVLLLDYLDISVKSPDEVERRIGLPVLGVIPLQRQMAPTMTSLVQASRFAGAREARG
jgi:capsular polysaccharide biosynthesis protein